LRPRESGLDEADALRQLRELVAEQKRRAPTMSDAQAYTAVYPNPANKRLADAERRARYARMGVEV
jgi:hypothetical protein